LDTAMIDGAEAPTRWQHAHYGGVAVVILSILWLVACDQAPKADTQPVVVASTQTMPDNGLKLSPQDARRIGLDTVELHSAQYQPAIQAIATAVDPQPLFQLLAEQRTAEAARSASVASFKRIEALFTNRGSASRQELDAARAQALQDEVRVASVRRSLLQQWGERFAAQDAQTLADAMASGRRALLRIELLESMVGALDWSGATLTMPGYADAIAIETAWIAPTANATRPGPVWLAVARTDARLPVDARGRVHIAQTAGALEGVIVPRSAVVYAEGSSWAFVALTDQHYQRRPLDMTRPTPTGYFVAEGYAVGERVVSSGAGLLLAEQIGSDSEEDED
jgi:hypothetical protein